METQNKMQYRYLGNTGLQVSIIGLGFGDVNNQEELNNLIKRAHELGINFIDCAEVYGPRIGYAEEMLGTALKSLNIEREDWVITTKLFWGTKAGKVNRTGLSRKHLLEGTKASLKRLQLDYVDVIFAHRYDPKTPMEEIVRGFDYIVRNGFALYWGTSEWPAQKIEQAINICEKYGLIKPVVEQPEYSMLEREKIEKEYVHLFKDYGFGTTIWSPLGSGVLTGKYNNGVPAESRANSSWGWGRLVDKYLAPEKIEHTRRITKELDTLAKELKTTPVRLALAWTLNNKDVSTAIMGARTIKQLEENVLSLDDISKLTPEIEERIEKILQNRPEPEDNALTWGKFKPRRTESTLEG